MSITSIASGLTKISLRRRSSEHPMAMFGLISVTAFAGMIALQPAGPALFSFDIAAEAAPRMSRDISETAAAPKTARLQQSDLDLACHGQAWGAEGVDCLAMIAKESGRSTPRAIRMIADATPASDTSNLF